MDNGMLELIQGQIGYQFENTDLLEQAFVRRSYSKEHGGEDNEVLEFIGDKALDFVIVKLLAEKYGSFAKDYTNFDPLKDSNDFISDLSEGKLTEIKKQLVCRKMLANRICTMGFQYELIMGKSDIDQRVFEQESVQEDLFEAIIGAVAIDSGWDLNALAVVVDLMLDPIYYLENGFDEKTNYVELLQQWYQKKYHRIPVYYYRNTWGFPDMGRYGTYVCELGLYPIERGFSVVRDTKSEARMAVAEQAYRYLEENGLLYTWIDEIGEPSIDRAVNQLQELYQKGHIGEPWYEFVETHNDDGNPVWECQCHVDGWKRWHYDYFTSKKHGKKAMAYDMLCDILGVKEYDET